MGRCNTYLADLYGCGKKVNKDLNQAFFYELKGAKAGEAECQNNAGVSYIMGSGTEKTTEKL